MDDLLDFSLDVGEEEEREENEGGIGKLFLLTFFRNVINLMILAAVFCLRRRIMQKKNWNGFQKKMHSQPLKHSLTSSPSKQPRNVSKQHIPVSVLDNTSTTSNSNHSDTTNKTNIHVHGHGNGSSILVSCGGSLKLPEKLVASVAGSSFPPSPCGLSNPR